jgi:hypothetical protein
MNEKVLWNDGGSGFGHGGLGAVFLWSMDRPSPDRPDFPSIVSVMGKPEDYTDEEMSKIVTFAEKVTERYDKNFRYRRGANLIVIGNPRISGGGVGFANVCHGNVVQCIQPLSMKHWKSCLGTKREKPRDTSLNVLAFSHFYQKQYLSVD